MRYITVLIATTIPNLIFLIGGLLQSAYQL